MLIQFGVLLLGNLFDDIVSKSMCILVPLSPPEFNRCSSCSISGPLIILLSIWLRRREISSNLVTPYKLSIALNSCNLYFSNFNTNNIASFIKNISSNFTCNLVDLGWLVDSLVRYVQVVILGLYSAVGNCQNCQFLLLPHSSQMRIVLF